MSCRKSGRIAVPLLIVVAAVALVGFLALAALRAGPSPEVAVEASAKAIGRKTAVTVSAAEPSRGLTRLRVELIQGERRETLADKSYAPRPSWSFWGPRTERDRIVVEVGRDAIRGLRAGPATIRATAERAPAWLRGPGPVTTEITLPVRLTPPALHLLSTFHYLRQGGSEAVVYRVGESATRDGVRAGSWFFPGRPLPGGGPVDRFALFAAPYDLSDSSRIRLVAADDAGNEAEIPFVDRFQPRRPVRFTFDLPDSFLGKVVPAILSQTPDFSDRGGLLENYLGINRDLRKSNADELVALAAKSRPELLWTRPFAPMLNAKVTAPFAEHRTYVYRGKTVDEQDHLGFDLAVTRAVAVPASNDGVVVLARYFGIYGNTVVLDHGYGLMSLYGHLSSIDVREGQEVKMGDILGRTGDTGLAGGDHLHFGILLGGLPVDPVEWWDPHWVRDRIARKLGVKLG